MSGRLTKTTDDGPTSVTLQPKSICKPQSSQLCLDVHVNGSCPMQGGRDMLAARRSAWDAAFNALFMQLRNGATDAFYCISPQVGCLPHTRCMISPDMQLQC